MILEEAKTMMSESLVDQISQEDLDEQRDRFIIITFFFKVDRALESVVGSLIYRSISNSEIELHSRVSLSDAFSLNVAWPGLRLDSIRLKLGLDEIPYEGPYDITEIGLKEINHERRTCVLTMKLKKT